MAWCYWHLLWMICARILVQPQTGELRQMPQVSDLRQGADFVLPHVELSQTPAAGEVVQGPDFVYTENEKTKCYLLKSINHSRNTRSTHR